MERRKFLKIMGEAAIFSALLPIERLGPAFDRMSPLPEVKGTLAPKPRDSVIEKLKNELKRRGVKEKSLAFLEDGRFALDAGIGQHFEPVKVGREKYMARVLDQDRIENGASFIIEHLPELSKFQEKHGVGMEYIAAIMGIESDYGGFLGKHKAVNALASIYKYVPDKREFAANELWHLLKYAERVGKDVYSFESSYAGAIGVPQFLPSNLNDGYFHKGRERDPFNRMDSAELIALFLKRAGWKPNISGARAKKALYSYNHSDRYVKGVSELAKRIKMAAMLKIRAVAAHLR